jgi:acyl-CoA reductase-like NAD-dependent aldehyde dehydrogenase
MAKAKAKKKAVRRAPAPAATAAKKAPAGLAGRVLALRADIVQALEVYLDQSDAVLAALEARLGGKGSALAEADTARLTRALDKLQAKLKPARGRAKDLRRVEKLLCEIEELLDRGAPMGVAQPKAKAESGKDAPKPPAPKAKAKARA